MLDTTSLVKFSKINADTMPLVNNSRLQEYPGQNVNYPCDTLVPNRATREFFGRAL